MRRPLFVAALLAALPFPSAVTLLAENPTIQELPSGIAFQWREVRVEATVASAHTFCLSVQSPSAVGGRRSVYLAEQTGSGAVFKFVHEGGTAGIETAFGKLLIDPDRKAWSLHDPKGVVLTDWAPVGGPTNAQPVEFAFTVGPSPTTLHPLHYGSGTVPDRGALTQNSGKGKAGNGTATLPQYWSTAGYGVLLVGANDSAPGTWKAEESGVVTWKVQGAGADLYLCPAPSLYDWMRADAELTGFAPVPPAWTFGYLQSRWGWKDKAYLDDVVAHFRQDRLPVDAFIIDFEWYTTKPDYDVKTDGEPDFADFNWNPRLFPDPPGQIADLMQQGVHLVGIRKPRLGNSENLETARSKGWIAESRKAASDGEAPLTRDLDFSRPEVRTWWARNNRQFVQDGMAAFWNDEGELDFVEYTYWNLAEATLQQQVNPGKRFWSLNRSYAPGLQRLGAAVWTGDYPGEWKTFARQPGEMLAYSLAGMPYSCCDIGGMDNELTPELVTRWMQAGVFFPIMRAHSSLAVTPRFPYLYGTAAEDAIRTALDLRYRLLPYYYSLAHENHATAAPLMRPLAMEFPDDEKVASLTDEWLMGHGLLAAPLLNEGGQRAVYLPLDSWYEFGSARVIEGPRSVQVTAKLDDIPVYVRAGTLLPLGPVRQWTSQPSPEPLELQIYAGKDGTFDLVEDNGMDRPGASNVRRVTKFCWSEERQTLTWTVNGDYQDDKTFQAVKVVRYSPQGRTEKPGVLGKAGQVSFP